MKSFFAQLKNFILDFLISAFFLLFFSAVQTFLNLFMSARIKNSYIVQGIIYLLAYLLCCGLNFLVGKRLLKKTPLLLLATFILPCSLIAFSIMGAYLLQIDAVAMLLQYPGFLIVEFFQGEVAELGYGLTIAFYVILSFFIYLGSKLKKLPPKGV